MLKDSAGTPDRRCRLVRSVLRCQGIEDAGDGSHSRLNWNRLACELARISCTIQLFVVSCRDIGDRLRATSPGKLNLKKLKLCD